MIRVAFAGIFLFAAGAALAQPACGGGAPCEIEGGTYHVALPENPDGAPAMVFLHGFGSSGAKFLSSAARVGAVTGRGYVLIAPDALPWNGEGTEPDWSVRDGWTYARDDNAFIQSVVADASARFGFDRARVLLAGFSRGGSMTWEVACLAPGAFAGYAAISGGFWAPEPASCAGPAHLLHVHGFTDKVVPLEGRPIDNGPYHGRQADIHDGLRFWRELNGCGQRADVMSSDGPAWRKAWTNCAAGSVTFDLWPGGHGGPPGWIGRTLDWFESVVPLEAKPASD